MTVFLPGKFHEWRSLVGYTIHGFTNIWTRLSTHAGMPQIICEGLWMITSFSLEHLQIQNIHKASVQFSHSIVSDSLWLHGLQHARLPVHAQLWELPQTQIHWVSNTIQPPPAFSLSQHQCLFQWVSSSHQVAKVLELQLQHPSIQWIFRTDFFSDGLVWSPCSHKA